MMTYSHSHGTNEIDVVFIAIYTFYTAMIEMYAGPYPSDIEKIN